MTDEERLEREGQLFYSQRRYNEALERIQALRKMGRAEAQLRVYEAECLYYLSRAPEAIAITRELYETDPGQHEYALLLARYLRAVGDFDESLRHLGTVPKDTPGYAMLMGWHLLRQGDFLEGHRLFQRESGMYKADEQLDFPREKLLRRGADVRGATVLLSLYGGFGDEIFGLRFASALEARGARVIVGSSQPSLIETLRIAPGTSRDVRENAAIAPGEYDWYLPAADAVDILELTRPPQTTFPYLFPDADEAARWAPKLAEAADGTRKIGIHWQGNWAFDSIERKSVPAALMALFAECGTLFSLQRDAGDNALPPEIACVDTQEGPASWKRTVAVASQMDYIVTNDTVMAHLGGALGVKTAVLLLRAPHAYWLPLDTASIWYPSARCFRQPAYNNWEGAVLTASFSIRQDGTPLHTA